MVTLMSHEDFIRLLDRHLHDLDQLSDRLTIEEKYYEITDTEKDANIMMATAKELEQEMEYGRYLMEQKPD